MKDFKYYDLCEKLFQNWIKNEMAEKEKLEKIFQMDYSPEPYFNLDKSTNPLHILLTNPGSGMDFQHRSNFSVGSSYKDFSNILRDVYLSDTFKNDGGANAYRRLKKSIEFAHHLGYNGVTNIETLPFHSNDFNKDKALKAIKNIPILKDYLNRLEEYLSDKPTLVVAACNSNQTISRNTILDSKWLSFQSELIHFNVEQSEMKVLTQKNDKITSALFHNNNKFFTLMMGSNNLPSFN